MYLKSWGLTPLTEGATLALSELVTNVVRHVPDRRCAVLILRTPGGVRVEVTDGSPELPAPPGPADGGELAEEGRGLLLVEATTARWGVTVLPERAGKTIWFECDLGCALEYDDGEVGAAW
ncbi:ATP-binding protein, partial [Streptomyces olivaceus]|uniref:ATP-binding protein n=1 Tax=Streptomyces olivaceus TaxID=47716 RepID=UPI0036FCB79C